jgi:predicted membrane channel-forming protein YqfA (hemolysin III family)
MAGLVVTLAPLVLLIANRDWFFTPEGFLDPWQYVGFFRLYPDLDYSPEDYKLARLPWILVGHAITRFMPTLPAAYVLHAIFLCALPLTFFGATYVLLRQTSLSAVVALCLGFYTHMHGPGGWDYHNTPSGPLFLATLWVLVLPSSLRGGAVALICAGVMAAMTAHANLTTVNLFPALLYIHLAASRAESGRWPSGRMVFSRAGWTLFGALLITLVLGVINWTVGRDFVFFSGLVRKVMRFLTGSGDIVGRPLSDLGWVLTSRYLAPLIAIFVSGIVFLVLGRRLSAGHRNKTGSDPFTALHTERNVKGSDPISRLVPRTLIVQFLASGILAILWQTLGQPVLDWGDNLVYALNLSAFLALAGLLSSAWPDSLERRCALTIAVTTVLMAICLVGSVPLLSSIAAWMTPTVVLAGGIVFLAPLLIYLWRPSVATAWLFVIVFAIGNRLVADVPQSYAADDPCKVQPAVYGAVVEAASRLFWIDPLYRRVAIWFSQDERISPLPGCPVRLDWMGYSIRTMTSMNYLGKPPMPDVEEMPEQVIRAIQDTDTILTIVSDRQESLRKWDRRLASLGLKHRELDRSRVPMIESGFDIHAWVVTSAP